MFFEFLVYEYPEGFVFDDPNKKVISFTPMQKIYNISLSGREKRQIRGMARYSDDTWYEICEAKDNVEFENKNPEIITVDENGIVRPAGKLGKANVKVSCGGHEFEVEVVVGE